MDSLLNSILSEFFDTDDHHLVIGDQKFSDIIKEAPNRPSFIYSKQVIKKKITALRAALPASLNLNFAIKSNPMQELVNFMQQHVDGLDVASGAELLIAINSGMSPDHISFAGPGKSDDELALAIQHQVTINVESENELDRIIKIGQTLGQQARIALRINPDFDCRNSAINMSGGPTQFGIDAEIADQVIHKARNSDVKFLGLHIYTGSQNLNAQAIIEAQHKTFELVKQLAESTQTVFEQINIGGGFGIPYYPNDEALDLQAIGNNLSALIEDYHQHYANTQFITELGRYIVGECGVYIARIVDKKVSRGKTFIITSGGLNHNLRSAADNFRIGQKNNYPASIANKIGRQTEAASVVGPLCTPLDVLAYESELPKAEIGDYFVMFQSGAYGYSSSPLDFLSHPKPLQYLV